MYIFRKCHIFWYVEKMLVSIKSFFHPPVKYVCLDMKRLQDSIAFKKVLLKLLSHSKEDKAIFIRIGRLPSIHAFVNE